MKDQTAPVGYRVATMARAIDPSTIMAGKDGRDWMKDFTGRVYLSRVYLDQGGYTSGGVYFGVGKPLYYIGAEGNPYNEAGNYYAYVDHFRASDRNEAKAVARDLFPNGMIRY
jgi:hypothetical protein